MTFVLDPVLEKIVSPLVIVLPDGTRLQYASGAAAARATFEQRYAVETMRAAGDVVEVTLHVLTGPTINWIGEEAVEARDISFF